MLFTTARQACFAVADAVQNKSADTAIATIEQARSILNGVHWKRDLDKLIQVIDDCEPRFKVFALNGNSKLPFVAFSALPIVTCPGAGECANWCYSLTSWRSPAAFCRQAQNTWLMRAGFNKIVLAFFDLFQHKKLKSGFDFRLYVDGDFSCYTDLGLWQDLLKAAPTVKAYGYSKSFQIFLDYASKETFASNYMVNLSSGHNATPEQEQAFASLPVVRGAFKAVNVGYQVKAEHYNTKAHNKVLREAYGKRAFVCPGKCGDCTPNGHACGSERFKGVDIIIAVH